MKLIEYNENSIYKILREYDFHYGNSPIALIANQEIPEEWVRRMIINEWYLENPYIFVINQINKMNMENLEKITEVIKGVIFSLSEIENYDYFSFLLDYCKENNLQIFFITDKIAFPYNETEGIIFGGSINELR